MRYGCKPPEKWVTKDNTHEPLVARDAFRTAREGRRSRRARHAANRMAKNQKREYLLPGFIRRGRRDADGKEHGFLNGRMPQSRRRVYPQYQCSHYERHGRSVCKPYALPMREEESVAAGTQGQEPPKGNGGAPERPGAGACTAELKELFRLIDLQLRCDPDTREGTLTFSPFAQHAAG